MIQITQEGSIVFDDGVIHPCSYIDLMGKEEFRSLAEEQGNINPEWVEEVIQDWRTLQAKRALT